MHAPAPSLLFRAAWSRPRRPGAARAPRTAWAWFYGLLLLALLAAPLLGSLHAVIHPAGVPLAASTTVGGSSSIADSDRAGAANTTPAAAPVPVRTAGQVPAPSWLERLFGHPAGGADCRLFDQLCQGNGPPSAALVLPVLLPASTVFVFFRLGLVVQRDALFHARAPPALR